jgi:hypothetical protein
MANGRAVAVPPESPLARCEWIVVADASGSAAVGTNPSVAVRPSTAVAPVAPSVWSAVGNAAASCEANAAPANDAPARSAAVCSCISPT